MIGQITPLVKAAEERAWYTAVAGHLVGAVLSAGLLGLTVGGLGGALGFPGRGTLAIFVVGGICLVCAISDAGLLGSWRPSLARQTPKWMLSEFGPFWGGLAWGGDLGQGWTTRLESAGYFALIAWVLLLGGPAYGAIVLGAFGLGRALPVLVAGPLARRLDVGVLSSVYIRRSGFVHQALAFGLALVAGSLLVQAFSHGLIQR